MATRKDDAEVVNLGSTASQQADLSAAGDAGDGVAAEAASHVDESITLDGQADEDDGDPVVSEGERTAEENLREMLDKVLDSERKNREDNFTLQTRLEQLERLLSKVVAESETAAALKLKPINRDEYSADKIATIGEFLVTFNGPDKDKYKQPIRVEAFSQQDAVARVVQAAGMNPAAHYFASVFTGRTFRVGPMEKDKPIEGFPVRIFAPDAETALRLARNRKGEIEGELKAEAV
jgi:hypothetical protein